MNLSQQQCCRFCRRRLLEEYKYFYCSPVCYINNCAKAITGRRIFRPGDYKRLQIYRQQLEKLKESPLCSDGLTYFRGEEYFDGPEGL